MTKIVISPESPLTSGEFKALLEQSDEGASALTHVFQLMRELVAFEKKFNISSDVFYARFMRGEMGDDMPFIKWAGRYELYLEAKQEIDNRLSQLPVAA